jgi:hypothetical protein
MTRLAIGVLLLDAAALVVLGYLTGRGVLVLIGLGFLAAAGLILLYSRWHRRRLDEIMAARRELSKEARAMLESVSGKGKT